MRGIGKLFAAALSLIGVLAAAADAQAQSSREPVRYRLTPVMKAAALSHMVVEVRFRGDADGETRFRLPEKWAGSDNLRSALSNFRVTGAKWSEDTTGLILRHRPRAPLTVRYRVNTAHRTDPDLKYEKARPVIRPGWFLLTGEGVFGVPEIPSPAAAAFSWGPLPKGWKVASDLDHLARERPGTVDDVVESVSIGGRDLTVVERRLGGKRIRIAGRGNWPFALSEFSRRMLRIIEAQNRYWRDPGRPFLVVVAPLSGGTATSWSVHGTGRTDAFALASTTNQPLKDLVQLLSHESMHSWIGREIGGPLPKDEALGYWLSEGFDDYLSGRILLHTGDWTINDYVDYLNRVLRRYARSSARNVANREIPEKFWSDSAVGQIPYDRGHLFALLIDGELRRRSGGKVTLDDILLAQQARAQADRERGTVTPAALLFPITVREQAGLDISALLDRYIERGETIILPEDLFGPCARIETRSQSGNAVQQLVLSPAATGELKDECRARMAGAEPKS